MEFYRFLEYYASLMLPTTIATLGDYYPFLILLIGTGVVLSLIIITKLNAFIALISGAFVVSLMTPGEAGTHISRVADAFGKATGDIGLVIGFAAIVGIFMMKSGAADRIVQSILGVLGEKRGGPIALASSGFVLSIPVFFDTVFYLLVPIARSMFNKTKKNYVVYLVAIAAGSAVTHTLVPPTPGPVSVASALKVDFGMMIFIGCLVGVVSSSAGLMYGYWLQTKMDIPMRPIVEGEEESGFDSEEGEGSLPSLFLSLLPILLPLGLIALNTIVNLWIEGSPEVTKQSFLGIVKIADFQRLVLICGDKNFALGLSAALAMLLYWKQKKPTSHQFSRAVESALMSGGVIILITSAGGAFGAMLKEAGLGHAIEVLLGISDENSTQLGLLYLFVGFGVAALFKTCQGSSTTAMIVTPGIVLSMIPNLAADFEFEQLQATLGYHPVYLALAIGSGSLCLSWMNDSGFWIFSKMGGLTESETFRSWSILLLILGVTGMMMTCIFATIMPLAG